MHRGALGVTAHRRRTQSPRGTRPKKGLQRSSRILSSTFTTPSEVWQYGFVESRLQSKRLNSSSAMEYQNQSYGTPAVSRRGYSSQFCSFDGLRDGFEEGQS